MSSSSKYTGSKRPPGSQNSAVTGVDNPPNPSKRARGGEDEVEDIGRAGHHQVQDQELSGSATNLHHWLRFLVDSSSYKRLSKLQKMQFLVPHPIDWELLGTLGLRKQVEDIFTPPWRRLLDPQPVCKELTLEFLSTFKFSATKDLEDDKALEFRLGGKDRHLSIRQFALLTGLYTNEELEAPIFTESYRGLMTELPKGSPGVSEGQLTAWWSNIGEGEYSIVKRASSIISPVHRYIHRVLCYTLNPRHNDLLRVKLMDLFYLYCLLHPTSCNLAYALLMLFSQDEHKTKLNCNSIGGGMCITRLAKELGVDTDHESLAKVSPTENLGMGVMKEMCIVDQQNRLISTSLSLVSVTPAAKGVALVVEAAKGGAVIPPEAAGGGTEIGKPSTDDDDKGICRRLDRLTQLVELVLNHLKIPIPAELEQP